MSGDNLSWWKDVRRRDPERLHFERELVRCRAAYTRFLAQEARELAAEEIWFFQRLLEDQAWLEGEIKKNGVK